MPDPTTSPADGQQGSAGAGAPAAGAGAPNPAPAKTFTQEELDAIVQARVARAIPSDYEDLKKLRDKVKEQEDKDKSELQRAKDEAAQEKAARAAAETRANALVRRTAIIEEAVRQNAADTDIVLALLAGDDSVTVKDDGTVVGAKQAVEKLLKDKPLLVKGKTATPSTSGGEFGGQDVKTLDARIKEAEAKGDWRLSRRLKIERMSRAAPAAPASGK